jgi:hypothetical protein
MLIGLFSTEQDDYNLTSTGLEKQGQKKARLRVGTLPHDVGHAYHLARPGSRTGGDT